MCRRFCICTDNGLLDDEAPEPQRSLFSWAEFMAEEPNEGRGGKSKPASTSLFEWALGVEQDREREADPAGAGR